MERLIRDLVRRFSAPPALAPPHWIVQSGTRSLLSNTTNRRMTTRIRITRHGH
jgi:hypothetical protein